MTSRFTYDDAMAFIHERSGYDRGFISNPFAGDEAARLGLVRTDRVLDRLGRPDHRYPILHVAGSKGKGSTASMLDAILRAAEFRSGRFLSPHLHRFNERFAINATDIGDGDLATIAERVRDAVLAVETASPEIGRLTAWEISTAIALEWFASAECTVAVIEVGMGGMLDATNVIHPAASLITRLDLEHTAVLGDTLAGIAVNKAGIIKPNVSSFSVHQLPAAMDVIQQRATTVGSSLSVEGIDWRVGGDSDDFTWEGTWGTWKHLSSRLQGRHQVENAGLAIATLTTLAQNSPAAWPIDESAIRTGLASAEIPGRFEVIPIDDRTTVVIDGAHSPESARVLANAVSQRFPNDHVIALVAMLNDKDPTVVLPPLETVVSEWVVSSPDSPRGLATTDLASALATLGHQARLADSISNGLTTARSLASDRGHNVVILVTGSLSTVTEARTALGLTGN